MRKDTHETLVRHVCSTPWPTLRDEIMNLSERAGRSNLEQAAMLVADAELRGLISETDRTPDHIWSSLKHAGHPLSWISARRGVLERRLVGRSPDEHYSSVWPARSSGLPLMDGDSATLDHLEMHAERGIAPFQSIMARSNGDAHARSFLASSPVSLCLQLAKSIAAAHPHIGPDALVRQVEPIDVVEAIAFTAINGGAYDDGLAAAFGRLTTWQAMSWLVGIEDAASSTEVEAHLSHCLWLRYEPTNNWFTNVGHDGCYACINADRVRIAIVAWTDTD